MKISVRVVAWAAFAAVLIPTVLWSAPRVAKEYAMPEFAGFPFRPRISGDWVIDRLNKDDKACASTTIGVVVQNVVTRESRTVYNQAAGWCGIGGRFGAWTGDQLKVDGFCSLKGDRSGSNEKSNLILVDFKTWRYYTPVLTHGPAFAPVVWGDYVAYEGENSGVYLVDLQSGQDIRVSSEDIQSNNPSMSGGLLVWEVHKAKCQISAYKLSTKETLTIVDDPAEDHYGPSTDGKTITWWGQSNAGQCVTVYDVATKEKQTIKGAFYAGVSDGIVVYLKDISGGKAAVFGYDVSTKEEFRISTSEPSCGPSISGNRVIWTTGNKIMVAEIERDKGSNSK